MNGTKEHNISGVVDGSRFVYDDPDAGMHQAEETSQPMVSSQPSPDAFMPRPTRPFPISVRDENPKRGNWWNKIEFIFACIILTSRGFTFFSLPCRAFGSGGGAFLILYGLGMIFIVFPYVVLEMALGQFSSSGIISMWNLSPLFKGFGILATLYLASNNVLTNVHSAYHLLYAFVTIKYSANSKTLPWLDCSNVWNTANCYDLSTHVPTVNTSVTNRSGESSGNNYWQPVSPAREYFSYILGDPQSFDLTNVGALQPSLVFALLATWGFVLALSCMGAKWTGKVAYFLLPVTVILLFALLIRGATLDGALDGLIFYFHIDRRALLSTETWYNAFQELVYASFLGVGVFSSLASYNKFHNNFCLDAFIVVAATVVINVMIVLIVATYIGFYSRETWTAISQVCGAELVYEVLPTTFGALPVANAWSCVFFLTMFLLFTSSSIYMVQALLTTLLDLFHLPHSFIFLLPTSGIICVLSFLISLPMVTQAGYSILLVLDTFTLFWTAPFVAIVLMLVSVWIYGTVPKWNIMRLPREIQKMVGFFPVPFQFVFLVFWAGILPMATAIYLVYRLTQVQFHLGIFVSPYWMEYIMFALGTAPLLLIPVVVAIFQLCKRRRGYTYFTQLFWRTAQSSEDWGPPVELHRRQVGYFRSSEDGNARQLNSDIHFNPATAPLITAQHPTAVAYPQSRPYSPPPPAYNDYQPGSTSPGSDKNLSPAPSSVASGLPSVYPSPLAGAGPPASPATVSATDTLDSNRLYPSASVDCTTGAETGLSEQEDSLFVNVSSHETTL